MAKKGFSTFTPEMGVLTLITGFESSLPLLYGEEGF